MLARKCNTLCATFCTPALDGCSNSSQSCNMHYYLMQRPASPFIFMNYRAGRERAPCSVSAPASQRKREIANSICGLHHAAPIDRDKLFQPAVLQLLHYWVDKPTDWLTDASLCFDWLPRTAFHAPLPATAAAVCSQKTFSSLAWKQNTTSSQLLLSASLTINRQQHKRCCLLLSRSSSAHGSLVHISKEFFAAVFCSKSSHPWFQSIDSKNTNII